MGKISLGSLETVNLRSVFQSEASDFTPWLAQEDNLSKLGETLEIELELESQEKNVGPFRADLLCKDLNTQQWVLIENQIERTDHNHLGQLLTYAAGLKAVTIIWIAAEFTDEHRAALDWLNEVTADEINFFGIEIELWKIGDSNVAPRFNVICKPNLWTHTVSQAAQAIKNTEITETRKLQLDYWTKFHDYMKQRKSMVHPQKPFPQHWMNFAIGRANFYMMAYTNTKDKRIGVGLVISGPDSKPHFHLLHAEKDAIENHYGQSLEWRELPGKKESHVLLNMHDCNLSDTTRWDEYCKWMAEQLEMFSKVFKERIKNLDSSDYVPPEPSVS